MLHAIKRWFSSPSSAMRFAEIEEWAQSRRHQFKRAREGEGFVVDAAQRTPPWRLEWGPSQRSYITGRELRLRGDVGAAPDVHMLLISRTLMESLERQVFEEYTENLQTRIDTATPEEMRWLVLYPKLGAAELKDLRERFGGVASAPQFLPQWLGGGLAAKLAEAAGSWLAPETPLVLIVQRGRLTLRTAMPAPDIQRFNDVVGLFEVALREARRAAEQWEGGPASEQSTQPSLWGREGPPTQT
jgi:hypothetical protein